MRRGRPATTRAALLAYWRKHGPCPIGQIVRATGIERSRAKRILRHLTEAGEVDFVQFPPGRPNSDFRPVFSHLEAA